MCGIAGVFTTNCSASAPIVERMSNAMAHRGPNDMGLEIVASKGRDDAGLVLAHRRLSILDLSTAGHQPMVDPDTGNWIVFNGEIYNFKQLRDELIGEGKNFHSDCDTEVILKGYAQWGNEILSRLRGMFAFAIVDVQKKTVLIARDRIGIKPLYYTRPDHGDIRFAFASEVRSLLASGIVGRKLSPAGVASYLVNGCVYDPLTIIDNVWSLLPGCFLLLDFDGNEREAGSFWKHPAPNPDQLIDRREDAIARMRSVLDETIEQHMISDVPLGAFLSGGIDSSALAALMVQRAGANVSTFSLVFDDPALTEEQYSRPVAKKLKTDHHEVRITESEFLSLVDDGLAALDQPTTDAINSYVVSRKCKETGLTVALAGTGGDELFGGYTSFTRVPKSLRALKWYQRAMPSFARGVCGDTLSRVLVGKNGHLPSVGVKGKLSALLDTPADALHVYHLSRMVLLPKTVEYLTGGACKADDVAQYPTQLEQRLLAAIEGRSEVHDQLSIFEQMCYMSNQLLRDTDAVSMAVALEVRVPLLDHMLIEAAGDVTPEVRFGGSQAKQLLIDSVRDILPTEAYRRRKMGFVLPIGRWLAGPLASRVEDAFGDMDIEKTLGLDAARTREIVHDCQSAGQSIFFTRLWGLFVLADWCRRNEVTAH